MSSFVCVCVVRMQFELEENSASRSQKLLLNTLARQRTCDLRPIFQGQLLHRELTESPVLSYFSSQVANGVRTIFYRHAMRHNALRFPFCPIYTPDSICFSTDYITNRCSEMHLR